jgi:hypothetical protein
MPGTGLGLQRGPQNRPYGPSWEPLLSPYLRGFPMPGTEIRQMGVWGRAPGRPQNRPQNRPYLRALLGGLYGLPHGYAIGTCQEGLKRGLKRGLRIGLPGPSWEALLRPPNRAKSLL